MTTSRETTTATSEMASTVTFPPTDHEAPVQTARSLLEAFGAHVRRTPDAVAVVGGDRRLTYAELDRRAGVIAARLHDLGVGTETPVALIMARSVDLVIAELAVLKAGGVYVPLHPGQSASRIRDILTEIGATVLCTDPDADWHEIADLATVVAPATIVATPGEITYTVDEAHLEQLAYIMFTSGSTGQPKGVAVTHDDILGMACDPCFTVGQDAVLVNSSPAFDVITYEMWVPLLTGRTAVMSPNGPLDAPKLAALITEHEITSMHLTTALFNVIVDEDPTVFTSLRQVWTGGDMISSPRAQRVVDACPDTIVFNSYGPTETTTFTHYHAVRAPHQVSPSMSIGRAMAGVTCHVLDERLRPVAPGEIGEVYLGGRGVARGYVRRPALTAERFVPDPFGPSGARLYRSGDLARPDETGRLEILGRSDKQVKIRGFRIELGEIESVVGEHPEVRRVAVLPHTDRRGEQRLVAYPVLTRSSVDITELRSFAKSRLADYMIPAFWIPLDELPVTSNGKLDRAALPAPDLDAVVGAGGPPRTDAERMLAELFGELLGVAGIGVDDHFFAMGGHSLLATRLASRVRRSLGVEVAVGDVFGNPTVRTLAEHVEQAVASRSPLVRGDCPERVPLSPAQQRLWFLRQLEGPSGTYNIPVAIRLSGALDVAALRMALGDLTERHETLRTCYPAVAGVPYQHILPAGSACLDLVVIDCVETELAAQLDEYAARDIDVSTESPLRAWLFELGANDRVLLLVLHHIAADGWSLRPLGRDLRIAYRARCAGAVPELPQLSVQYADYSLWQREVLGSADDPDSVLAQQLTFWRRTLDGAPDALDLPIDRPRPAVASTAGAIATGRLEPATHAALQRLATSTGCSVFMVLHAAFAALLTRIGAGTDLPIGTAVAGRTDEALDDLIGFFVNTLVLRTDTTGNPTFHQLLHRIRNTDLNAYTNQDTPFDQLVETLNPERSTAHHPLFHVMLVLQNNTTTELELTGLTATTVPLAHRIAKFDLTFGAVERRSEDNAAPADGLALELEYRTDLFDGATAESLLRGLAVLLTAIADDPDQRLDGVELMISTELAAPETATTADISAEGGVSGPYEDALRTLFADVLEIAEIGPEENFFARGGYSLLATRLVRRVNADLGVVLGVRALFQHPTPRALAGHLTLAVPPPPPSMPARQRPTAIPLSPAQQRLWFQSQWDAAGAAYNIPIATRLRGELDRPALVSGLTDVLHRHESLRTIFPDIDGQPRQQVVDGARPVWTFLACTEEELADRLRDAVEHAFDLATDLPIRAWLFELGTADAVLLLVTHHIAADGGSLRPLATDLALAYVARRYGRAPDWAPVPVQYADHTLRELDRLGDAEEPGSALAGQLAFWRTALHGVPEELVLPIDRPRPAVASQDGGHVDLAVDATTHGRLLELSRATGSTLFMVLQAALAAVLSRLGAGSDIPIGTATAGRDAPGIADAVGFFVNTIVLRADVSGRPSFYELLNRVRRTNLAAYSNADAPFEQVVGAINPPRSTGRHPLFQVMVVAQDGDGDLLRLDGLRCDPHPTRQRIAEVDLFLGVRDVRVGGNPGGVYCSLSYRTDLFDHATAAAITARLGVLLAAVAEDPDRPVTEIDLLTARDRRLLAAATGGAGQRDQDAGVDRPVHEEFEQQACLDPGATALVTTVESVSAGELNARANRLSHELITRRVGPGDRVALLMPRCAAAVVAMLAVHKSGAAFVQIDPDYPAARLMAIVAESQPAVMLTVTSVAESAVATGTELLAVDDPTVAERVATRPATDPTDADRVRGLYPQDAAYVLYTSGSTGRPKGVVVEHRNLANLFRSHRSTVFEPHLAGGGHLRARVATTASLSFDGSWIGLLWLMSGHELHLLDDDLRREPASVAAYVHDHRVDFLDTSPTYAQELCVAGVLDAPAPRTLTLGGEAVPTSLWRRLREAHDVDAHNFYGPTECTVDSLQAPMAGSVEPSLGRPVRGTGVLILDANLQPVPPGVTGEVYITGNGLARGYLGQPAVTAERFVPDPVGVPGKRMYRSGDLARMRADGTLDFAGRTDDQVKIRGFRIEPGEVEGVLGQHPSVAGAAVVVRDDRTGGPRLVAYAVLTAGVATGADELRRFVAERAPAHLVPAAVVLMDALPRTSNGKLDRTALPPPADAGSGADAGAPRTPVERLLCDVFAQVLGVERVPVDAGFFELGGHSLLASRLVGRISAALGTRIGVQDLFRAPTVAGIAALARRGAAPAGSAVLLPLSGGGATERPPLFCVHPVTGIAWCYAGLPGLLGDDRPVYGLQSRVVDPTQPPYSDLAEMVDEYVRHIRSVQAHGPYHLLGWSLGGNVAHAVAARLEADGDQVALLALLDSYPPQQEATPTPTTTDMIGYIEREGTITVGQDAELGTVLARAAANSVVIVDGATPPDFTGNVVFFTATKDRDAGAPTASLWQHHVAGGIAEHDLDCAHLDMTRPEPLARIAAVITSALTELG